MKRQKYVCMCVCMCVLIIYCLMPPDNNNDNTGDFNLKDKIKKTVLKMQFPMDCFWDKRNVLFPKVITRIK